MRLVVISHTPHYLTTAGVVGWAATVRELDHVATLVDQLVHVAPVHDGIAPAATAPYESGNVTVIPLRPAGGEGWRGKLDASLAAFGYLRVIRRELPAADAVHVRFPANVALVALFAVTARRRPHVRWFKYAGEWQSRRSEPVSYRLQRLALRRGRWLHRGVVTVNGTWPRQPRHVRSFHNPALTDAELSAPFTPRTLGTPLRMLVVGRLDAAKQAQVAVAAAQGLAAAGANVRLDVVGDGPLLHRLRDGVGDSRNLVYFHGFVGRPELRRHYAQAHLLLVPSRTEGFPKVIAEAAASGVVPVVAAIPAVEQFLSAQGFGLAVGEATPAAFATAVETYMSDPGRWERESRLARDAAAAFTYEQYLQAVRPLLHV